MNTKLRRHPLSAFLTDLEKHFESQKQVSFQDLLDLFDKRGHAFFLFLFALPAAVPMPAVGLGTLLALPLLVISFQKLIGKTSIWMPNFIANRSVSHKKFESIIDAALPHVIKLEVIFKPRLQILTHGAASQIAAFAIFFIALAVAIPLPFTNTVPCIAITVISVGFIMSDGLAVLAGIFIGLGWIAMLAAIVFFLGVEGLDIAKDTVKSWFGG